MKYSEYLSALIIVLILFLLCQDGLAESYGMMATEHLNTFSGDIGARYPGSIEEEQAGDYILDQFQQYGYSPVIQSFTFTDEDDQEQESRNIIAEKRGSSSNSIIIGAHYDSMDEGDGADDNGSGTAVLLELAERLYDMNTSYSITFVAFGAEENDLDGSRYYVHQLDMKDKNSILGFIDLDGLIAGNVLYLYGDADTTLYNLALNSPDLSEFTILSPDLLLDEDDSPCYCGDFSSFQEIGIPIIFIEATDYSQGDEDGWTQVDSMYGDDGVIQHTSYDTIPYINSSFPGRIEERLSVVTGFLMDILENNAPG